MMLGVELLSDGTEIRFVFAGPLEAFERSSDARARGICWVKSDSLFDNVIVFSCEPQPSRKILIIIAQDSRTTLAACPQFVAAISDREVQAWSLVGAARQTYKLPDGWRKARFEPAGLVIETAESRVTLDRLAMGIL